MDWTILLAVLVGAFIWWRHTKEASADESLRLEQRKTRGYIATKAFQALGSQESRRSGAGC